MAESGRSRIATDGDPSADHYPVAIVEDRYGGVYSRGAWLAVSEADCREGTVSRIGAVIDPEGIGPSGDDVSAMRFWARPPAWIAVGATPQAALDNLAKGVAPPTQPPPSKAGLWRKAARYCRRVRAWFTKRRRASREPASSHQKVVLAAEEFVDFLGHAEGPPQERLRKLSSLLDRLLDAYHRCETFDGTYGFVEDTHRDDAAERKAIGARFPELGYYASGADSDELIKAPSIGDAIDDLCDISDEIRSFLWLWRNRTSEEALSFLRMSYEFHWGRHLLGLRLHLHNLTFER